VAPTATEALLLVAATDLVGLLPVRPGHAASWAPGVVLRPSPVQLPPLPLSLAWHRRMDADGAHRWLRRCVAECVLGRDLDRHDHRAIPDGGTSGH
jgi:DNA-binding transcriptional LysR family regulator